MGWGVFKDAAVFHLSISILNLTASAWQAFVALHAGSVVLVALGIRLLALSTSVSYILCALVLLWYGVATAAIDPWMLALIMTTLWIMMVVYFCYMEIQRAIKAPGARPWRAWVVIALLCLGFVFSWWGTMVKLS